MTSHNVYFTTQYTRIKTVTGTPPVGEFVPVMYKTTYNVCFG